LFCRAYRKTGSHFSGSTLEACWLRRSVPPGAEKPPVRAATFPQLYRRSGGAKPPRSNSDKRKTLEQGLLVCADSNPPLPWITGKTIIAMAFFGSLHCEPGEVDESPAVEIRSRYEDFERIGDVRHFLMVVFASFDGAISMSA
jgi:hypothetical protein